MSKCSIIFCLALFLSAWAASAQSEFQTPLTKGPFPWTKLQTQNSSGNFQFAVIADRCGGHREGVFEDAITKLNLLKPAFVLCVGDLIEGYTENPDELGIMYADIDKMLSKLQPPFFFVPGNHDLSNPTEVCYYQEHRGPTYYHFVYQNVLFLCMSSEDTEAGFGPDQLSFAEKTLKANPEVRWTFIFFHKPLWKSPSSSWTQFEALLADRPHTVFAGHEHQYVKFTRQGHDYYMLGTTGGDSVLSGPDSGRVDHVTLVNVGQDAPTVLSVRLDGILSDDFVTNDFIQKYGDMDEAAYPAIDTLLTDGNSVKKAETVLRFVNNMKTAAKVTAIFPPDLPMSITPAISQFLVDPMSKASVKLSVEPKSSVNTTWPLFAYADVKIRFEPNGERPREMMRRCQLIMDQQFWSEPVAGKITVDGKLDEWKSLPLEINNDAFKDETSTTNWSGPGDSSVRFAVGYDEQYVYFAAAVHDPEFVSKPDKFALEQDGVGFLVDFNPSSQNRRGRTDLAVGLSPNQPARNPFTSEKTPDAIQAACIKAVDGYTAEMAFPVTMLQQKQGENWRVFRANVGVNDVDADGRALLWWRPAWDSTRVYPNSGLFTRK